MYWFTGDEHYFHENIIEYSKRPYGDVHEMNEALIANHNSVVGKTDIVIHVGDFTLKSKPVAETIIKRLKGQHVFLKGSHDRWLKNGHEIWEKMVDDQYIVCCHYAMRRWPRSHYESWQLYGHSHGKLVPFVNQWDVGVDNNNYFPVSREQLWDLIN